MATERVRIEIPIETVDNTENGVNSAEQNLDRLRRSAENVQQSMNSAQRSVSNFDRSTQRTQRNLMSWLKEKYQLAIEAKDNVSPILKEIGSGLKSIGGKAWSVTLKAIDKVTSPVRGILNILRNPLLQAGAVLGISISLKDTVDTYASFESTMSRVKALSNANNDQMEALTEKAKEMGAQTKFSGTESAEAFTYMAQAGWEVQDMIDGIGGVMSLAAADGLDLATTTDIVSNALTAFGMTAKDTAEFADVLAVASSASNTNVSELGEAFKYIAPVAGAMGYSIQDASLALGLMSNNAVKGSMAGTALKTALANMAAPTDQMATAMQRYGISLTDSYGNMKSLKGVMDNLRSSLGGLSETEQTAAASTIFGKEAMAGMLAIINTSEEDYKKLAEAIDNSEGAADKMAATMQDNLAGSLEQLGGATETVQLSWGERMAPYIIALSNMLQDSMPYIEEFGIKVFDMLDKKIEEAKEKIDEFTSSQEWADADIFGKFSIAWDKLIGEPFSEWWDTTGKGMIADKLRSFGHGIGTATSTGILALLGIDVTAAIGEGESIGSAFVSGLIEGFDINRLKGVIFSSLGSIFGEAGKLLPGGQPASLSSVFSAAAIGKYGIPLLTAGVKGYSTLKRFFGTSTTTSESGETVVVPGLGRRIIGSASQGTGLLGFGANTAMKLGAGNLPGGASLSSGALSAIGLGSIAGGMVGGIGLLSGGYDFVRGFTSSNASEASAYKKSGAAKVGGVGAGAAIGAGIGSLFGGIGAVPGALIGAGIGGLVGIFGGNKIKKDQEEEALRTQKIFEATGYQLDQMKFKSEALNDALNDTDVSAAEFATMFQNAISEDVAEHFGKIRLSLEEIKEVADELVIGDKAEDFEKFSEASEAAKTSMKSVSESMKAIDKLNWKGGLGLLSDSDIESYKSAIDNMLMEISDYVENQHYKVSMAVELLAPDGSEDITQGIDDYYAGIQEQLDSLGSELTAKTNIALEDGVITLDEQSEIANIQSQISSIMQKISEAEMEAGFEALKIKYSGADLDMESYAQLQSEIQQQVAEATGNYDEALQIGIASLKLQLSDGAISEDEYNEQLQALTEGYEAKISDLSVTVENFQLQTIAEAYSEELEGILPDLEGTTAEKLQTALHNAIASGVDPVTWDTATASQWLGLDGLSVETQTAISEMMSQVAASLPDSFVQNLQEPLREQLNASLSSIDFSDSMATVQEMATTTLSESMSTVGQNAGDNVGKNVSDSISSHASDVATGCHDVRTKADGYMTSEFAAPFNVTTDVNITANYHVTNPFNASSLIGQYATSVGGHASGGIVGNRQLSWVGEEGPEAIIPLVPSRRNRAMELYEETGRLLGLGGFADGGIVGLHTNAYSDFNDSSNNSSINDENIEPWTYNQSTEGHSGIETDKIHVNVSLSPRFEISGEMDETSILNIIRGHLAEMADEIGGEIAEKIGDAFSNMPLKGA